MIAQLNTYFNIYFLAQYNPAVYFVGGASSFGLHYSGKTIFFPSNSAVDFINMLFNLSLA